jgi:hypothetical protein
MSDLKSKVAVVLTHYLTLGRGGYLVRRYEGVFHASSARRTFSRPAQRTGSIMSDALLGGLHHRYLPPLLASPLLASPLLASPLLASPLLASPLLACLSFRYTHVYFMEIVSPFMEN